jgi:hypothetical protein
VPGCLWAGVFVYYLYRRAAIGDAKAAAKAINDAFFVLFLMYPLITSKLFKILNCRTISAELTVLSSDYTVNCATSKHKRYQIVSYVLILVFAIGVPVSLAAIMIRAQQVKVAEFETPQWKYITRKVATQLATDNLQEVKHSIMDTSLGSRYGALVKAFKPGFFWWEFFLVIEIPRTLLGAQEIFTVVNPYGKYILGPDNILGGYPICKSRVQVGMC